MLGWVFHLNLGNYYILLGNYLLLPNYVCIFNSGMSQSYTNPRDKNTAKAAGYFSKNRGFDERNSDSATAQVNQVIPITRGNSYFL